MRVLLNAVSMLSFAHKIPAVPSHQRTRSLATPRRVASAALLASIAVFSTSLFAATCDGFVDVDSSATYCAAVTFVQARAITIGCTDSTHYCPNDYVTRAQMALFLQRAARASSSNSLADPYEAIGGGLYNTAGTSYSVSYSVVAGGYGNSAIAGYNAVGGGSNNQAGMNAAGATVSGGYANKASGDYSAIPGGFENTASGEYSFAAGFRALADQDACAVFSLWSGSSGMTCLGSANVFRVAGNHGLSVDYFSARPDGGGTRYVAIGDLFGGQTIATWTGAFLSDGGTWTNASDRAAKEDFVPIDPSEVLGRVAAMPITRWRYKRDPAVTHLGPVAQDFRAAFGLGLNDTSISTVDEEGVALAAIQGLNAKLDARDALIAEQARQLAEVRAQVAVLTQRLATGDAIAPASASLGH